MAQRSCSVDGCEAAHYGRGYCARHYRRWRRHGDPLWTRPTAAERFWSKVDVRGPDECWPWTGGLDKDGYGSFSPTHTTRVRPHRFAYELAVEPIPPGLELDHTCHDARACVAGNSCQHRRCCNPAHLEAVTTQVNIARSASLAALNAAKTHCHRGHPLRGDNLRIRSGGGRECKECRREIKRRYDERQREALRV